MKRLAAAIIVGVVTVAACPAAENTANSLSDEVAVYRALAEAKQISSRLKILTNEEEGMAALDDSNKNHFRKALRDAFGDKSSEALEDAFTKQGEEHALVLALSKEPGWLLVDKSVLEGFRAGSDASTYWKRFYKKFPDSGGTVVVFRVGFNYAKDVAVVYVFQGYGSIGAEGSWYYLEHGRGKWTFIKKSVFMMA